MAKALKGEGYTVVSLSRSRSEIGDLIYEVDVTNREEDFRIINEVLSKFGKIDVLVNNAGFGIYGSFLETSLDEEEYMVKTLFLAPIYFTKAVLPHMVKRRSGSIVNIVSEAAYVTTPKLLIYSAAKSALASFTNGLWAEMRKYNVKVSGIYPGPVKTNFTSHPSFSKNTASIFDKYAVEPQEVANAVIKGIKTGKREIYVPSKLKIDPYILKLSMASQSFTYGIVSKYFG
ncbi:3-oxoacyl-ACP reductase [Sulfolobus acidocaldarius]|uniref:Short chain dehydrogenase n=4 Tax=Sulfolobus acidocaldarius TaxID=2285 RepID=Q4J995_SULAC|nr:short chain dehydrogenase [Sulfolobus acidocaldarius DSM 639]AGE71226.1 short chain dehydrogenase [Sulfolobus acidocaldarius N8]AGE73496.1 short chain dehydrogenase [Sulfolobus acidocaldarius Ron12/I]ALU28517.1 3-oxoacyl-ACP reductase [Sulfolobus acidocaldarius]ALU31225.1 3-oxoacyl-ACP reductase [Sulfolobus acidocaldarius]